MGVEAFCPFGIPRLSAGVAAVPIAILLWALLVKRMSGVRAGLLTLTLAVGLAVVVYRMPIPPALPARPAGAASADARRRPRGRRLSDAHPARAAGRAAWVAVRRVSHQLDRVLGSA